MEGLQREILERNPSPPMLGKNSGGSLGGRKGGSYKLNYGYLTNTRNVVISMESFKPLGASRCKTCFCGAAISCPDYELDGAIETASSMELSPQRFWGGSLRRISKNARRFISMLKECCPVLYNYLQRPTQPNIVPKCAII